MIVSATMDTVEVYRMYGEVEAPCDAEHFQSTYNSRCTTRHGGVGRGVALQRERDEAGEGFTGLSLRAIRA